MTTNTKRTGALAKPTSLERLQAALEEATLNPHVTVKTEDLTLTQSDPNSPVYNYRGQRYGTMPLAAVLYTVRYARPEPRRSPLSVQLLLTAEGGRFISADGYERYGKDRIEELSKSHPSQPFGWKGITLTEALEIIGKMTPAAIAAEQAEADEREREHLEWERIRERERHIEQSALINAAREKAVTMLGDAATDAVLDYFLPIPVLDPKYA